MSKAIGSFGIVDQLTIAGRTFTDLPNLIVLAAHIHSGANTSSLVKSGDVAGTAYTPSGSKKFHIMACRWATDGATAMEANLGYCDNDIGYESGNAPTNPKYTGNGGVTSNAFNLLGFAGTGNSGLGNDVPIDFYIANGKFGFVESTGASAAGQLFFYGYEE